uniref:Uncharacterized protein n=1 Tax=Cyanophora paradoxa TaxID=2762 RepID=A0A097PBQ2_CYAPA|nr:hypothetical protein [Cyanophora paradoxa]
MFFRLFKHLNFLFFFKNKNFLKINNIKTKKDRFLNYRKIFNFNIENIRILEYKHKFIQYIGLKKKIKKIKFKQKFKKSQILKTNLIINTSIQRILLRKRDKLIDNILFYKLFNNSSNNIFQYNKFFKNILNKNLINKNEKKISYRNKIPSSYFIK